MRLRRKTSYSMEEIICQMRRILLYSPETGVFTWIKSRRVPVGSVAGSPTAQGYITIPIFGVYYRAHRLAWLWMTGEWPAEDIDHEDLDKSNNRWLNLREATKQQNKQNRGLQRNSTTGLKGVSRIRGALRWRAAIGGCENRENLGRFDCPAAAHFAYLCAAADHYKEFARHC